MRFFTRMGEIYGQLWFKRYPNEQAAQEGMEEWLDTFRAARLKARQVREAITACKLQHRYPPSHKEFVDLALGREADADGRQVVGTQAHRPFEGLKQLPRKLTDEEKAKGAAALADLLNGTSTK